MNQLALHWQSTELCCNKLQSQRLKGNFTIHFKCNMFAHSFTPVGIHVETLIICFNHWDLSCKAQNLLVNLDFSQRNVEIIIVNHILVTHYVKSRSSSLKHINADADASHSHKYSLLFVKYKLICALLCRIWICVQFISAISLCLGRGKPTGESRAQFPECNAKSNGFAARSGSRQGQKKQCSLSFY